MTIHLTQVLYKQVKISFSTIPVKGPALMYEPAGRVHAHRLIMPRDPPPKRKALAIKPHHCRRINIAYL